MKRARVIAVRCVSCEAPLDDTPSFCSACGRPTSFASHSEKIGWELDQWRAHNASPEPDPISVVVSEPESRAPEPEVAPRAEPAAPAVEGRGEAPAVVVEEPRRPAVSEPRRVYRTCTSCNSSDWVLRAGRNDDGTWRYWCVRCAAAFRTDLRIGHAAKPWLVSACVVTAIVLGALRLA